MRASSVPSASFSQLAADDVVADTSDNHLRSLITTAAAPKSQRRTFTNSSLCAAAAAARTEEANGNEIFSLACCVHCSV